MGFDEGWPTWVCVHERCVSVRERLTRVWVVKGRRAAGKPRDRHEGARKGGGGGFPPHKGSRSRLPILEGLGGEEDVERGAYKVKTEVIRVWYGGPEQDEGRVFLYISYLPASMFLCILRRLKFRQLGDWWKVEAKIHCSVTR